MSPSAAELVHCSGSLGGIVVTAAIKEVMDSVKLDRLASVARDAVEVVLAA